MKIKATTAALVILAFCMGACEKHPATHLKIMKHEDPSGDTNQKHDLGDKKEAPSPKHDVSTSEPAPKFFPAKQ